MRRAAEEVAGQGRDVFAAVRQARDVDADDVQAVEQVFAELARLHQGFEVLVGGGDDAHVDLDRCVPADTVELAVGQHTQQAGLRIGRHVTDFIQKQGAAVGLLKAPAAQVGCAGKRAFFVAEQLGLHQVFGDGGHVQRNKGRGSTRAVAVQGVGDQLFAGARLAIDQYGDVGMAQAPDGAKHFLHRWRFADDFRRWSQRRRHRQALLLLRVLIGALDQRHGFIDVKWLGQVLKGAALIGRDCAVQVRVRGHDDHGQARVLLADPGQQIQAAGTRHADIGNDHVRLLASQATHDTIGAVEALCGHAFLLQGFFQDPAD